MCVDHGSHRVRRVVEAVDKFEAKRNRQREPKQYELKGGGGAKRRKVRQQAAARVQHTAEQHADKDRQGDASGLARDLGIQDRDSGIRHRIFRTHKPSRRELQLCYFGSSLRLCASGKPIFAARRNRLIGLLPAS